MLLRRRCLSKRNRPWRDFVAVRYDAPCSESRARPSCERSQAQPVVTAVPSSGPLGGSGDIPGNSPLLEISNVMVHVYKDSFGRGPTKARARFSGPDTLIVLLEDTMTVAERKLVALGEYARVREHRLFLQLAFEDLKRSEVERILSRRTVAWICGIDPRRDIAAEIFTLEPSADESAPIAAEDTVDPEPSS